MNLSESTSLKIQTLVFKFSSVNIKAGARIIDVYSFF